MINVFHLLCSKANCTQVVNTLESIGQLIIISIAMFEHLIGAKTGYHLFILFAKQSFMMIGVLTHKLQC